MTDAPEIEEAFERPASRHRWGDPFVRMENTPSGCVETERICKHCGMTRFTVHPPEGWPWTEWKAKGQMRVQLDQTPVCLGEPHPP
jgi:hypothetical protein